MSTVVKKRRRKVNKSLKIKEYLDAHPEVGPTEAAKALTEQGVKVSATHVSNVKARLAAGAPVGTRGSGKNKVGRKAKAMKAAGVVVKSSDDQISLSQLIDAKRLVEKFGSIESAQRALSALSKLG